ncbi:NADPH-dependent 2,4-dienoyl-CoA reductase, partial [Luminiphilus sp.]|nr:NADPH-dependent 2,4-dienoyl-CoA reductase [Luminiphilus sp.]
LEEMPDGFERMAAFYAERAVGGIGMIITGGISPNEEGGVAVYDENGNPVFAASKLNTQREADGHKLVTQAVHGADPDVKIIMQILHMGPLAHNPNLVAPSKVRSRISKLTPNELDAQSLEKQIADHAHCAVLAKQAGYDGVEIIGSAGYLLSTFLVEKTNQRTDEWGGSYENRMRFPLEVVRRIRAAVGDDFIVVFRIAAMDMLQGGMSWDEIAQLARELEKAGVSIISTHFVWHEANVPTIATMVPRAAFTRVTGRVRKEVAIPVITSNRINMPEVAEEVLERGDADLVSMARPMLADSEFMNKAATGRRDEINTCIACNQACLDHTFSMKTTSCLVNPRACHETMLSYDPTTAPKSVAVIGAGPAGMAYATVAAERGHKVTLFDAAEEIGGQFNLAKRVPGKEEFHETIRYYNTMLTKLDVDLRLGARVSAQDLENQGFDHVVVATGITPRTPQIGYIDAIMGRKPIGKKVAVLGAGGIGFDVTDLITHDGPSGAVDVDVFAKEWGIDFENHPRGGVTGVEPVVASADREVYLIQRKSTPVGRGLGKTTGWTHRTTLGRRGVNMVNGVDYRLIDDDGLHLMIEDKPVSLDVDTVIVCAGQEPLRTLFDELEHNGVSVEVIGGAFEAAELDAKAAINQASWSAAKL